MFVGKLVSKIRFDIWFALFLIFGIKMSTANNCQKEQKKSNFTQKMRPSEDFIF